MKIDQMKEKHEERINTYIREITQDQIVVEPSLRSLCKMNSCGKYGTNWMCPPGVGDFEVVSTELKSCKNGAVIQMVYTLEDSYDFEGMQEGLVQLDVELDQILEKLDGQYKREDLLVLGGGSCRVCDTCTMKSGEPCRYPDKARASIEAYGVDVNPTISNIGLKYNNGPNTVSYVGMILERIH